MAILKIKNELGEWQEVLALKGDPGAKFSLLGLYPTIAALQAAHPIGQAGDAWAIGNEEYSDVYIWDVNESEWINVGLFGGIEFTDETPSSPIPYMKAEDVEVVDSGEYFAATNVEDVLQEIGNALENIDVDIDFSAVEEDIIPANSGLNLGSAEKPWNHLYIEDSTIFMGNAKLSLENGEFTVRDKQSNAFVPMRASNIILKNSTAFGRTISLNEALEELGEVANEVSDLEISYLDGVTGPIQTQLNAKEATITAGTTTQYWRGDKTWQTLNATAVGAAAASHTHDASSDITSGKLAVNLGGTGATDAANARSNLGAAPIVSPTFTGQVAFTPTTLATTGTVAIDFAGATYRTQAALTGNITYTGSNYAAGRSVTIRVINGTTLRTLTFPAGWVFVGTKPANIAASKRGILTITSFGTTEADCVAAWAVQV